MRIVSLVMCVPGHHYARSPPPPLSSVTGGKQEPLTQTSSLNLVLTRGGHWLPKDFDYSEHELSHAAQAVAHVPCSWLDVQATFERHRRWNLASGRL